MTTRRNDRDANLHSSVRRCLLEHWDPIGVNHFAEAKDEYDSYVPGIVSLLLDDADEHKLRKRLIHHETVHMGLTNISANLDDVVTRLLSIGKDA